MHVIELIEQRRRSSLHLEEFFSQNKPDPFFIKNLENVQGDERDVIFLGVGYARNDAGTLSHNFGPLNRQGGERRLNVAITRARESLTLFASIRADDIDLGRTQARGAKLLRAYLDFAERGNVALAATETEDSERDYDSEFEAQVARALTEQGLDVRRQIGCSGYRIDLALVHPAHPGRYVLGIECDGATYHSSATARDRDRLRQDVLESLDWKICRIWSTDWIRDPRRQTEKVLAAYHDALIASDCPAPQADRTDVLVPAKAVKPSTPTVAETPRFLNIDEVPADLLRRILAESIESFGAMPPEDLMQAAARKLGFQRTGSRIRNRVSREVHNLQQRGELVVGDDGRLRSRNGTSKA
jgi:very-short-patch-repair endonuclease